MAKGEQQPRRDFSGVEVPDHVLDAARAVFARRLASRKEQVAAALDATMQEEVALGASAAAGARRRAENASGVRPVIMKPETPIRPRMPGH